MEKKGFTILEILVSAMIMALVMAGLASVFIAAKRHIQRPRAAIGAGELERYLFSDLQMQVRQDQWGNNCLSNNTGCPSNMTIGGTTYNLTWSITNVMVGANTTNLRKARVTLTWPKAE